MSDPDPQPAAAPDRFAFARRWARVFSLIDREAAAERAALSPEARDADDRRVRQLLVVAAVLLVLGYTVGDIPFFMDRCGALLKRSPRLERYSELIGYTYWAFAKILGYGLLPLLHILLRGESARDYGLRMEPARPAAAAAVPHLPWLRTYLVLFAGILPFLVAASFSGSFRMTYPFYRLAGRSWFDFLAWEAQYLSTFVAVEFFFRGYLLFGLRRVFGSHALFIAMVPYCMIHVLKPAAEALGSIAAGILLGLLALSTGSLWCGVLLHVSVALSMDVLSSLHTHGLPRF